MQSGLKAVGMRRGIARAFTLIELLVVIVIIVLLISILLPALKKAREAAVALREQALSNQWGVAHANYAYENKDAVFTGYIPWAVGHLRNGTGRNVWLFPDPNRATNNTGNDGKYFLDGNSHKVPGARFMGATSITIDAISPYKNVVSEFLRRQLTPASNPSSVFDNFSPPTREYDTNTAGVVPALAYHPFMGINYTYVGGSRDRGAMPNYNLARGSMGHPRNKFYVTHTHEINFTSRLILGASSRGVDIASAGGFTGNGNSYGTGTLNWSATSATLPGWWIVTPPSSQYANVGSTDGTPQSPKIDWSADNTFRENTNPTTWGYLHPRHSGKAVVLHMDNHVEMNTIQQMRDMRRWANKADKPDWVYVP